MKKWILIGCLLVVAFYFSNSDMFIRWFQDWNIQNRQKPSAPKLQYFMAGYLYMVSQRQDKAVDLYTNAFKLFPGYPKQREATYRVGLYYESAHNYPKAIEYYTLVMTNWPDMAEKYQLGPRIDRFRTYSGTPPGP